MRIATVEIDGSELWRHEWQLPAVAGRRLREASVAEAADAIDAAEQGTSSPAGRLRPGHARPAMRSKEESVAGYTTTEEVRRE